MNAKSGKTSYEPWHERSAWKSASVVRGSVTSGRGIIPEADRLHQDTVGSTALQKGGPVQDPGALITVIDPPWFFLFCFFFPFFCTMSSHKVNVTFWSCWYIPLGQKVWKPREFAHRRWKPFILGKWTIDVDQNALQYGLHQWGQQNDCLLFFWRHNDWINAIARLSTWWIYVEMTTVWIYCLPFEVPVGILINNWLSCP